MPSRKMRVTPPSTIGTTSDVTTPFSASPSALVWLVPLLSLPQTTHYALDGLVWRKQGNPELGGVLMGPH